MPECPTRDVGAESHLPAPGPHRCRLRRDTARERENEPPGKRRRRLRVAAGRSADRDAARPRGRDVDRGVPQADRDDELQTRQGRDQRRVERRALAHQDEHVELGESSRQSGFIGHMVVEHHDAGVGAEPRPVGEGPRDILVVVEDGDS